MKAAKNASSPFSVAFCSVFCSVLVSNDKHIGDWIANERNQQEITLSFQFELCTDSPYQKCKTKLESENLKFKIERIKIVFVLFFWNLERLITNDTCIVCEKFTVKTACFLKVI